MTEDIDTHRYFCLCCRQNFSHSVPHDMAAFKYMDCDGLRYDNRKGWLLSCPHCLSQYYQQSYIKEKIVYTYLLHKHLVERLHIDKSFIREYEAVRGVCEERKKCTKCGRTKYMYEFILNNTTNSGFGSVCRECELNIRRASVMHKDKKDGMIE